MSGGTSDEVAATLRVAAFIARFQEARAIGANHLLLAIMSDPGSRWAGVIEARGVGTYTTLGRAAGKLPPLETVERVRRPLRYIRSMRRKIVDLLVGLVALIVSGLRGRPRGTVDPLEMDENAASAMDIAERLAHGEPSLGHLLVALASIPGKQIKLLRREHRLIAAAAREELGIARTRDKTVLLLDRPALACRRLEARLRPGRVPARAGYYVMRAFGVLWAIVVFGLDTFATIMLYLFLWPALLLLNGMRAAAGIVLGVDFRVRRSHEMPGGEIELRTEAGFSDVRVALAVLLPRLGCFAACVLSMLLLFWQTARLGVYPFQVTIARHDIVSGNVDAAVILAPAIIYFDASFVHGPLLGIGVLAGIGAGILAVPSFREVELVGMAGAHDFGGGSRFLRVACAPLLVVTALVAFFEAILPFRGGPLYLTMYVIPLALAFLVSLPLRLLLPY